MFTALQTEGRHITDAGSDPRHEEHARDGPEVTLVLFLSLCVCVWNTHVVLFFEFKCLSVRPYQLL